MNDDEIEEAGRKLQQSAWNLYRSAPDLDALLDFLWEGTAALGEVEPLGPRRGVELGDVRGRWVGTGCAYNARITTPDGAFRGTVTFLVRLCGMPGRTDGEPDDVAWPWLQQASMIVGWHTDQNNEDERWELANFEPTADNIGCIQPAASRPANDPVWAWHTEEHDWSHFFALPLFALQSEDDARRHVLEPLAKLFANIETEDAFPANTPAFPTPA